MNAFFVTVSIPILLILVGFNHAYGLTAFGKNNQATQQPQKPIIRGKSCTSQANCQLIKGTTCLNALCLCGNNEVPLNGNCTNLLKGPNHLCQNDDECVNDADCLLAKDRNKTGYGLADKICVCREGFSETPGGTCGGESNFLVLPGIVMLLVSLSRSMY